MIALSWRNRKSQRCDTDPMTRWCCDTWHHLGEYLQRRGGLFSLESEIWFSLFFLGEKRTARLALRSVIDRVRGVQRKCQHGKVLLPYLLGGCPLATAGVGKDGFPLANFSWLHNAVPQVDIWTEPVQVRERKCQHGTVHLVSRVPGPQPPPWSEGGPSSQASSRLVSGPAEEREGPARGCRLIRLLSWNTFWVQTPPGWISGFACLLHILSWRKGA